MIVQQAIDEGLPEDSNSIYLIFPSEDVKEIDVSMTIKHFMSL
jgi:hypothetical protein